MDMMMESNKKRPWSSCLLGLAAPLTPEFWNQLYGEGRIGEAGANLLVLLLARLVVVAGIIFAAWVIIGLSRRVIRRALRMVSERSGAASSRLSTLYSLLSSAMTYVVYFITAILVLFTIGITWQGLAPLLGAASILGLAVGFGAQRLVRDVITGLFILGEGQFDVGDWVSIGGVTGRIEEMGLRVTRLRDEAGRSYIIANGDISQVFNSSRGYIRHNIEINLSRSYALDEALAKLLEAASGALAERGLPIEGDFPKPAVFITGMDASLVNYRIRMWAPVEDTAVLEDCIRRRVLEMASREPILG